MDTINPYSNRGRILDSSKFFGRKRELSEVFNRLATMQSVSVIGERRIGKSSFLNRIANPKPDELDASFTIRYLDLQRVFSAAEFYERACRELKREQGESHLDLEEAIQNKKVVFCLDEFEQAYEQDFGSEFFNALRSLAQTGNLALVVATQTPLNELHNTFLQGEDVTSKFHNIFDRLPLGEFTPAEAKEMVEAIANGSRFNDDEVRLILRLGKTHPYWLNIACARVFDAKQKAKASAGKIDLTSVEQQIKAEMNPASATAQDRKTSTESAVNAQTSSFQSAQTTDSSTDLGQPLPKSVPGAQSSVTILGIVALFTFVGAITGWIAMQQMNPVGVLVATAFLSTALGLFLYDFTKQILNRRRA